MEVHQNATVKVLDTTKEFTLGGNNVAFGMVQNANERRVSIQPQIREQISVPEIS